MASQVSQAEDFEVTDLPSEKQGTAMDRRDMARMGMKQEFRVRTLCFQIMLLVLTMCAA